MYIKIQQRIITSKVTKEIKWNNKKLNKPKGDSRRKEKQMRKRGNKQNRIFKASHVKSTLNVNSIGSPCYISHKGRGCDLNKKASPNYMLPVNNHFKQRHTNK